METEVAVEKARTIVQARATHFEAPWMHGFVPRIRDFDSRMGIFGIDPPAPFAAEHFSHLSPAAIPVYEGVFSRTDEAMRADAFTKGAVCVTNLFQEHDALAAGGLIASQVEMMVEKQSYPAVDEDLMNEYVDILVAILCNEEKSTWRDMLSYSAGVWWMLGLTRGRDDKLSGKCSYRHKVFEIVMAQAKRGSMGVV